MAVRQRSVRLRMCISQHALAFLQINNNTQVIMYFATDGGIYRALMATPD
jgi:hypothetical protein